MKKGMESERRWWSVMRALVVVMMVVVVVGASASATKEYVLTLDHSNFNDTISKYDFIVVEFYAPWCGHCQKLAPEYEKAAGVLSGLDPPLVLAKIDASNDTNQEIAAQYNLQGFPTIKILRNGGKSVQEYNGPREADGIVHYVKRQSGPASVHIESAEQATHLIGDQRVFIAGVFPNLEGQEFETFLALADKLRSDYEFAHTSDAKYLPRGDSSATGPLVRLFKPFDELFVDFKDFDVEKLAKFVEQSSVPLVTVFDKDPNNYPYAVKYFDRPDSKAMLFVNFSTGIVDSFKSKYQEVAKQYKGQGTIFLIGDVETSKGAFDYFALKEEQAPLIIVQTSDGTKYLKTMLEPEDVGPWLKDYKDGKLQQYRKTEPIPEVNNEPVKVVVADSIDDMFFNSRKNVFLEFYAPWCGHCKQLASILEEVAVHYENDSAVVIAKIDATANDYPTSKFEVQGFPTMYFKSASGEIERYEEGRSKEDIIGFIEKKRDDNGSSRKSDQAAEELAKPKQQESVKDEL